MLFAKKEGRNDIERAFRRLLIDWNILNVVALSRFAGNVKNIYRACFILLNMIVRGNDDTGYDSDKESLIE